MPSVPAPPDPAVTATTSQCVRDRFVVSPRPVPVLPFYDPRTTPSRHDPAGVEPSGLFTTPWSRGGAVGQSPTWWAQGPFREPAPIEPPCTCFICPGFLISHDSVGSRPPPGDRHPAFPSFSRHGPCVIADYGPRFRTVGASDFGVPMAPRCAYVVSLSNADAARRNDARRARPATLATLTASRELTVAVADVNDVSAPLAVSGDTLPRTAGGDTVTLSGENYRH